MSEYFDGGALSWGASFVKDFHGPVLGICLGMQILARLFQESLVASRELGVSKVRLDTSNELFRDEIGSECLSASQLWPSIHSRWLLSNCMGGIDLHTRDSFS